MLHHAIPIFVELYLEYGFLYVLSFCQAYDRLFIYCDQVEPSDKIQRFFLKIVMRKIGVSDAVVRKMIYFTT